VDSCDEILCHLVGGSGTTRDEERQPHLRTLKTQYFALQTMPVLWSLGAPRLTRADHTPIIGQMGASQRPVQRTNGVPDFPLEARLARSPSVGALSPFDTSSA